VSKAKITFINHACFTIEKDDEMAIVDPWFFGKVFNNSWSLMRETTPKLDKLKYIFITHEHPDHLHWPTLKYIKENTNHEVSVVFGLRKNKNVVENIRKLGFLCAEIPPNTEYKINNFLKVSNYPTNHDSAYIFVVDDVVILNQNDCHLSNSQCLAIKQKYPKIDVWWMQFSLAGYYANHDDEAGLSKAREHHTELIENYFNFFKPNIFVPFASFVYFCKQYNSFLNNWILSVEDIYNTFKHLPLQILYYDDQLQLENFTERTQKNLQKWKKTFDCQKIILEHRLVSDDEIISEADKMLNDIKQLNKRPTPPELIFQFYDKESFFKIDCAALTCSFVDEKDVEQEKIAGILPSDELYSFFKFPWGADTLNITSCFEIKNSSLWRNMLIFKDQLYER